MTYLRLVPLKKGNRNWLVHTSDCPLLRRASDERKLELEEDEALRRISAGFGCQHCTKDVKI